MIFVNVKECDVDCINSFNEVFETKEEAERFIDSESEKVANENNDDLISGECDIEKTREEFKLTNNRTLYEIQLKIVEVRC